MPILKQEPSVFPEDLLTTEVCGGDWYLVYTKPNREKVLLRHLLAMEIPFYCPIVKKTWRTKNSRLRHSFVPLFTNYAFVCASDDQRYQAMTTNCIRAISPVDDTDGLKNDLSNLERLINAGSPVTLEEKLEAGTRVRVRAGHFSGCEGTIIERRGSRRLLVAVNFLQQGASVELEDFAVEGL